MKLRFFALLAFPLVCLVCACTKFESTEPPGNDGNPYGNTSNFTALINGIKWVGTASTDTASSQNGGITISGIDNTNQSISIFLNDTVTGVYPLNANTVNIAVYIDGNSANPHSFTSSQSTDTTQAGGEVTLTDIDTAGKTISGTFQFNVYRKSDGQVNKITQGQFNKIPYSVSPAQANYSDTFYVQIDSLNWAAPQVLASAPTGQFVVGGASLDGSQSVILIMPQNITPGNYTLSYAAGTYLGQYDPNDSTSLEAQGTGSLQILENNSVDGRLRGSFSFLAQPFSGTTPSVQLSGGYFSVHVQ
jgi:hypothetical protein